MFDPAELLAALDRAGVEHIIIGGLAVAAHGYVRATKDLDIVPSPDAGNLERLAALLRDLDAELHGLGDLDPNEFPFDPRDPGQLAQGGNFVLLTRLGRLDVLQWVSGIDADSAYPHLRRSAITAAVGGTPVLVCSRDDLIAMKRAAGRPRDLEDLRQLNAAA